MRNRWHFAGLLQSMVLGYTCTMPTEGQWVLYPYGDLDEIYFASLDFRCSMADVYEDVDFSALNP
jgi:hypothetical protein